ncbi:hypothetical protein [Sinorhizobium chiapasense]|uniref:Uncharacterized protein n=1 Tax=Sinorhizobium chiapasense TaxID=501572 RepID=A0ABZ2BAB2_9HYPH
MSISRKLKPLTKCRYCGVTLDRKGQRFCSESCRSKARRVLSSRKRQAIDFIGGRVLPGTPSGVLCHPGCRPPSQVLENIESSDRAFDGRDPFSVLVAIKVNEVTQKVTDGRLERVPGSHGQWPGYQTQRPLAWLSNIGWPAGRDAWTASCGKQSFGPAPFEEARAAAFAFAMGDPSWRTDTILDPVRWLNAVQAGLLDATGLPERR